MSHVRRFSLELRIMHGVVMGTFLGLTATGIPLLFSEARWAHTLATLFGGFRSAGIVHRLLGVTLLGAFVWHVGRILWRAIVRREKGLFWGPASMVPQPRDVADLYRQFRWFFGVGPRPRLEQFTYWEKFDYWAVLWGTFLMGLAGLVLWFPEAASRVLPGWMFNVALLVHGAEAALAIGFIFVVHFFNGHLRPGKFPMDLVIFTGAVREDELRHERADQYERLLATGALRHLAVDSPPPAVVRRSYIIGAVGLTAGLGLFALILYAVLR
jgi:cytochrome b subunit of formate dehydrogenase